jgi:hypothetical protein
MTSPVLDSRLAADQIARSFNNLFGTLRASAVQQLTAMWYGLPDYRDENINEWLNVSLPMVQAAQETSASATATYFQLQSDLQDGNTIILPPDFNLVTGPAIRNGVRPEDVYIRPFKDIWGGLSKGKDIQNAIQDGANRLRQLVETDIQLSHTHTARHIISNTRTIQGARRVTTPPSCALCLIASTQFYRKKELMPIHPGCDCRVVPAIREGGSHVVDKDLLEEIHAAIAKQFGISDRAARKIDYRKVTLVREHGEYGPTLTVSDYNFTGPADLSPAGKELALA